MTTHIGHVFALSGGNQSLRDANGKPIVPFCTGAEAVPLRLVFPDSKYRSGIDLYDDRVPCDRCALIESTAVANIGEPAIRRSPFSRGGTYTLAAWFYAHRILGSAPIHPAWTRWSLSPAYRQISTALDLARGYNNVPVFEKHCELCGLRMVDPVRPHADCYVCGAKR